MLRSVTATQAGVKLGYAGPAPLLKITLLLRHAACSKDRRDESREVSKGKSRRKKKVNTGQRDWEGPKITDACYSNYRCGASSSLIEQRVSRNTQGERKNAREDERDRVETRPSFFAALLAPERRPPFTHRNNRSTNQSQGV